MKIYVVELRVKIEYVQLYYCDKTCENIFKKIFSKWQLIEFFNKLENNF